VNGSVLTLLALILAGLLVLGALGTTLRSRVREAVGFGGAGLSGLAAILVLVALVAGGGPTQLGVPIGLPGSHFRLLLDPLSSFFALLVFSVGTAALAYASKADTTGSLGSLVAMVITVAGLGLVALGGDSLAFATGLALAGGATWVAGRTDPSAHASRSILLATLLGAAAVVGVDWMLGAASGAVGFAAARAAQSPDPLAVPAWIALMIGMAPLAGLAPVHCFASRATETTPPIGATVLWGAGTPLAFYALLRVTSAFDGRPLPAWCGVALLLLGISAVLIGGIRATRGDTLGAILTATSARHSGVAATALGIAVVARALDLPQVAALSLAAVLVAAAVQAVCGTLSLLSAGAIHHGAATRHLTRLGGMIHAMPVCTLCLLVGLFGFAASPPGPGFAVFWLLFQALLAVVQAAGPALQAVFVIAAAALGLGAALSVVALVRLIGVVCLGRPRTPRAAAAKPLSRAAAKPLLCLAGASLFVGIFVGLVVRVLVNPAIHEILGASLGPRASLLGLAVAPGGRGYAALPLSALLALAFAATARMRRRLQPADTRAGPAWEGGSAASPPWLPFGDPLMQSSGMGFTPLPDELPSPFRRAQRMTLPRLRGAAVGVVILALLLAIVRLIPR
jgi:hydrogenase-4 component B